MYHRLSLVITALASAGAALGCAVADTDAGFEPTSSVASPILNATNVDDDEVDGVPQLRRRDIVAGCSGVLLTNQWILTDAHCVVNVWPTDRRPMANMNLAISLGRQYRAAAAEIRIHPTLDAALVRVGTPLPMNGRGWGYLRPLYASPRETVLGNWVRCLGYGSRVIGEPMGSLGSAFLQVESVSATGFVVQPSPSDQAIWYGDSGGPCLRDGALVGIAEHLHADPAPGEIVGADEVAIWALRDWILNVYHATYPYPHQRSILWRDPSTGTPVVWRMEGATVAAVSSPLTVGNEWQVQGTGDFDGDGEGDILWRSNTGQLAIWYMSFGYIREQAYPGYGNTPVPVPSEWVVKGVGDFDGNGHADILWRRTDGHVGIWYMNGSTRIGEAYPGGADVYGSWQIQGVGDFDGNHHADILWRHSAGSVAIWFDGNANTVAYPGTAGVDWQIKGVGDFNGNGRSDILWRRNSGLVAIWYDGKTAGAVNPGAPGLEWQILGAGDFDGNGRSDILWKRNDGATAIWLEADPALVRYPGIVSQQFQGVLDNPF